MSITAIKLVAAFTMILDHIAEVFGFAGWQFFSGSIIRNIARISFPLFAFSIVNGWQYTKSKYEYFSNIALFAIISQIPYSLAFAVTNTIPFGTHEVLYYVGFSYKIYVLIFFVFVLLLNGSFMKKYSTDLEKYHKVLFLIFLCYIINIKINGIWILYEKLNVLNTFLCGLLILYHYEYIKKNGIDKVCISSIMSSVILILLVNCRAEYGDYFAGIALIVLLYFSYNKKLLRCIVIIVWSFIVYALLYHNVKNALFSALSVLFVILYDKNKMPYF